MDKSPVDQPLETGAAGTQSREADSDDSDGALIAYDESRTHGIFPETLRGLVDQNRMFSGPTGTLLYGWSDEIARNREYLARQNVELREKNEKLHKECRALTEELSSATTRLEEQGNTNIWRTVCMIGGAALVGFGLDKALTGGDMRATGIVLLIVGVAFWLPALLVIKRSSK